MDAGLRAFRDLVRALEGDIDLGLAALRIARIEHPDLVPGDHLERLDRLALRSRVADAADERRALDRLRRFLFEEEGFQGDTERYYDARNSCLNDVLDRKLGIPITLSVLMMEVGRRVGVPMVGIGLPGHFVVGARIGGDRVLFDPFHGGAVLTEESASGVVGRAVGRPVKLTEEHFAPCSKRQILVRMLRNLKGVYAREHAWEKALRTIDHLLVLDGESPEHLRDRGTALVNLGRLHHGAAEWERYLARYPHARDAEGLREELRRVRGGLASLN